ncbi:DUF7269 family protein [Natrialba taiwanensis]|uniref:Uncharacterized protein n=1 Tax=Natrialba taiwanensis DSM 12281 TaxID=1230458 RepID=L9ZLH2_9EURY|nr:hypothetical protein C484_17601 [Natrialba taiwanensis DSM 12281]
MKNPSSIIRGFFVIIGISTLCTALLVLFFPTVEEWAQWPWDGELLLVTFFTVVFTIACLLSPFILLNEPVRSNEENEPPETMPSVSPPGYEFEQILDRRWPASLPPARRQRIRSQLRETTIQTIVRTTDCTTASACEQIKRETWTDNSVATTFVRIENKSELKSSRLQSIIERVYFPRQVRQTVRAIQTFDEEAKNQQ